MAALQQLKILGFLPASEVKIVNLFDWILSIEHALICSDQVA